MLGIPPCHCRFQRPHTRHFDEKLLQKYMHFYVHSFFNLLQIFAQNAHYKSQVLNVFSPSSVFLDERPSGFTEYCIAKAAAEECCMQVQQKMPNWIIRSPRLPRILTDQTSALTDLTRERSVGIIKDLIV